MGLITDLTAIADSILGIRDSIGAVIQPVYLVTRTWTGAQPGDGTFADVASQMFPSPGVNDLATDFRAQASGHYEDGDLWLKNISKQSYATRVSIDCTTTAKNVEKFYKVGVQLYYVKHVSESYITWDVRVRKVAHQG